MNPEKLNKYLYIEKTPTWLVRSFYIVGLITWGLVVYGYWGAITSEPIYRWIGLPVIGFFTLYTVSSFGLNLFYRQFNLPKHIQLLASYWQDRAEPSVDVFLPICGESLEILEHTWTYVARLNYTNIKVYVLDDSREQCTEHKERAEHFGFEYIERPNKGEMKKAGNLKYAYERTRGEHIVIFDADFAPRSDFLKELLPYMSDPKVGIVQSPQYFEMSKRVHQRSALEYGAANIQECFYRFIEVVRDRFGATVCCGTNAIYRRAALDEIGGTVQAGHSEDQRTGFALQSRGWIVRYVPVIVAVGLCPDVIYPYFHQQHRWCTGNIELMLTKSFWTAPISWQAKFCYITGFLFYMYHLVAIVFSFQLFWWLLLYHQHITLANGILFYPYLLFTVVYIGFFNIARFRWGVLYALCMRLYAYCHSIIATLLNSSVGWVATGAKQTSVSNAFKQTAIGVSAYVFLYTTLVAVALRLGDLDILNPDYYPIEFWLFYNLAFSSVLLWDMYSVIASARKEQVKAAPTAEPVYLWRLKTAGTYATVIVFSFGFITLAGNTSIAQTIAGTTPAVFAINYPAGTQPSSLPSDTFTKNLALHGKGSEVKALQQFLNTHGSPVATSGAGSLGQETYYFNKRTYVALKKFQKANGLSATGYFGPETRNVVNAAL